MNEFQYVNEMQMAKELWTQQGIASFICVVALANSLNRTKNKLMFWLSQNFIYHYMYDSQIYSGTFVGEIGKLESLRNWEHDERTQRRKLLQRNQLNTATTSTKLQTTITTMTKQDCRSVYVTMSCRQLTYTCISNLTNHIRNTRADTHICVSGTFRYKLRVDTVNRCFCVPKLDIL